MGQRIWDLGLHADSTINLLSDIGLQGLTCL